MKNNKIKQKQTKKQTNLQKTKWTGTQTAKHTHNNIHKKKKIITTAINNNDQIKKNQHICII